jgi:hypothetical protein
MYIIYIYIFIYLFIYFRSKYIFSENANIFNIQEPATASQLSRGYIYIEVVTLEVKP